MFKKIKKELGFLSYYKKNLNNFSLWLYVLKFLSLIILISLLVFFESCKKLVEVPAPISTVTTSESFSSDALATAAMTGVYYSMINANGDNLFNGVITIYSGISSDELKLFNTANQDNAQFFTNSLTSTNGKILSSYWTNGFSVLYGTNAVIDGLSRSTQVHDSVKNELTGEAEFVRAFCNFYLCNLFGDIPLVNNINWRNLRTLPRSPADDIYKQIIADLLDAQNRLSNSFNVGNGQRIIPTNWAAMALLSRVYLYKNDWSNAESQANAVISNSSLFNLNSILNDVFKINSTEAIWQLQQSNTLSPTYNATNEGYHIIPSNNTSKPNVYLSDTLLHSFEINDKRRASWVDSTVYLSVKYFYPKKYKTGPAQTSPNGSYNEYYMALRLAEQYLIRAEARAMQNNLSGAITDINVIRNRAGLPTLPNNGSLAQAQVIAAIQQENRIEFFAEWAHRWLDLKRWGKVDAILSPIKGTNWQTTDQLYPIPIGELIKDPNLTQNLGY